MRIIAGRFKGRRLVPPKGRDIRPTSDKLRETLFNVVAARLDGARVLDGFAGTGANGIEALSRGAADVTFIERDGAAVALIEENLRRCGIRTGYAIIRGAFERSVARARHAAPFDLILLDPPYEYPDPAGLIAAAEFALDEEGLLVMEHARRRAMPSSVGSLVRVREIVAGDSALGFFQHAPNGDSHTGQR